MYCTANEPHWVPYIIFRSDEFLQMGRFSPHYTPKVRSALLEKIFLFPFPILFFLFFIYQLNFRTRRDMTLLVRLKMKNLFTTPIHRWNKYKNVATNFHSQLFIYFSYIWVHCLKIESICVFIASVSANVDFSNFVSIHKRQSLSLNWIRDAVWIRTSHITV